MPITGKRGFVFSLDAGIAATIVFCMLFLVVSAYAEETKQKVFSEKKFELWKNSVFAADSLVKNSVPENTVLGSAVFDKEKHRVKGNEISEEALESIKNLESPEFEIKRVSVISKEGEKNFFSHESGKKNCLAIERMVLFKGEISKLVLVACNG